MTQKNNESSFVNGLPPQNIPIGEFLWFIAPYLLACVKLVTFLVTNENIDKKKMAFETWKSFRNKKDLRHELQMQRYLKHEWNQLLSSSLYILLIYRFQEDHLVAKLTDRWIANASAPSSACQSKFNPMSPVEGFRHCSVSKFSGI